jgi:nitrogen fixation/metabolism regulation signal transduction histidine kinase
MMRSPEDTPLELAQRLARMLRHEIGDLLQSVYSTTAVLVERLPAPLDEERRLLTDLKGRAELCKLELDAVVDLVSAAPAAAAPVELSAAVHAALPRVLPRRLSSLIRVEGEAGLHVRADRQALGTALTFLLLACCQTARQEVRVTLGREAGRAFCLIERDGFAATADQLAWLDRPFATTRDSAFGLALALARRAVEPPGGAVAVENRDGGGIRVRLLFAPSAD